jgi:hypothetical protein
MKIVTSKNIIVAGSPGAWINIIAGYLQDRGWQVTWPGQDIDIFDGEMFLRHNKQNIEVHNIHQRLCDQYGVSLVSAHLPEFYDVPYPGPAEFLAKFKEPVVISGTCLSPFLDMWTEAADVVIDIQAAKEEDISTLHQWTNNSFADKHVEEIRDHHLSRYKQHLKLFPKVFTMTNSEVRDRRLDGLVRFLNSAFSI